MLFLKFECVNLVNLSTYIVIGTYLLKFKMAFCFNQKILNSNVLKLNIIIKNSLVTAYLHFIIVSC